MMAIATGTSSGLRLVFEALSVCCCHLSFNETLVWGVSEDYYHFGHQWGL